MKIYKKDLKESICVILILFMFFITGYAVGESRGFNEGVEVNHGDKWDCAYAYSTGFLMCDRTPKYK